MSTISASTTTTTAFRITTDTAGTLVFQTGSTPTTAVTIDASQQVGVGVVPSAWDTVYKAIQVGARSMFYGIGSEANMANNAYYNSGYKYVANSAAGLYTIDANVHKWYNAASGTAGNAITFTQAMTLDASGNLGVGLSSLGYGANARLTLYRTSMPELVFADDLTPSASAAPRIAGGTAYMTFSTNGSERMRIDSSGNLLVGTTSTTQSHRIVGVTTNSWTTEFFNNYASLNYGVDIAYTAAAPNGTGNQFLRGRDSSATRFEFRSNGGLANYSGNNANLSDRREKTNFAPAGDYLAKICAIPVQTFNYIDQNLEEDDGLTLGVVAQDVQAVAPELVMESNWAKEGDEPRMRLSIYQTDLQYALMKCIQEQQTIIEQLETRLTALEAK